MSDRDVTVQNANFTGRFQLPFCPTDSPAKNTLRYGRTLTNVRHFVESSIISLTVFINDVARFRSSFELITNPLKDKKIKSSTIE